MLHTYLALLKSVQVLVFPAVHDDTVNELGLRWLRRHFQPTQLGLPPAVIARAAHWRDIGTPINYPHGSTARVFTELSPDISAEVRDALVLSSCYIAPLLVLGSDGWERLSPYALWCLRIHRAPEETETLQALRLAADAVARWFPHAHEAYHTLLDYIHGDQTADALEILREKRRILVSRDAQRLFAELPHSPQGAPFAFVADPFNLLVPWLRSMRRNIIAQLPWDDFASTGLGFVAGVVVTTDALQRFFHQEKSDRLRPSHRRFHPMHRHRPHR